MTDRVVSSKTKKPKNLVNSRCFLLSALMGPVRIHPGARWPGPHPGRSAHSAMHNRTREAAVPQAHARLARRPAGGRAGLVVLCVQRPLQPSPQIVNLSGESGPELGGWTEHLLRKTLCRGLRTGWAPAQPGPWPLRDPPPRPIHPTGERTAQAERSEAQEEPFGPTRLGAR